MTYSKFSKELLENYEGGAKKHNLNSILKIKDKSQDYVDAIIPADYHDFDSFIKKIKNNDKKFSSITLNVESLKSKLNDIKIFIGAVNDKDCHIDALFIQETWLTDEQCAETAIKDFEIPGYQTIPLGRKCGRKGGLIIYLRECYKYEKRDLYKASIDWEGIFIDITHKHEHKLKQKITLANVYRPPRNKIATKKVFLKALEGIVLALSKEHSTIITGGDFNMNLLELTQSEIFQEYFDLFISNGFIPQITLPTRFAKNSASLIDQIFCRFSKYSSSHASGIIMTKISDHLPCFSIINVNFNAAAPPKFVKVSKKGPKEIKKFQEEFQRGIESAVFETNLLTDPNSNYTVLEKILTTAETNAFPEEIVKFNKYKHRLSPWITYDMLNLMKARDNLYVLWKKSIKGTARYTKYEKLFENHANMLRKITREAKKMHYHKEFEQVKSDIKKTWGKINELLSRNRKSSELPSYFCVDGSTITSNQEIANCFNKFFSSIGPSLAQSIQGPPDKSFEDYLKQKILFSFSFDTINPDIVLKCINDLKSKSSFGHDKISSITLKHIGTEIAPTLSLIINQSLLTGIFPDSLKIAKIVPVFKKEDPHITDNYRPISLLPIISKIFEKIVFKQVYEYFTINKLLYKNQYGFRKKHSTELAGLELNDIIINNLDNEKIPIAIFLDLSKAFDTIDHQILLKKLHHYGITGIPLKWFESYLTNRKQYVQYKDATSDYSMLKTGVPQGSILGPLLFIIYMNDLARVTNKFHFTIYADDTTLLSPICTFSIGSSNYDKISQNINKELTEITDWLAINKLSLNAKKTKMMLFHYPQRNITNIDLKLFINNARIEQVNEFNFLGVMFDEKMSWKSHTQKIGSKISVVCGTLSKLKRFLPQEVLKIIYNALILPRLNYGILLWGQNIGRITKLQKWAIRAITNSKYNAHCDPLFKELKLLKVQDIYKIAQLKLYYRYKKNDLPDFFDGMFERKYLSHPYPTRARNEPITQYSNKPTSMKSIRFCLLPAIDEMPPHFLDKIDELKLKSFAKRAKISLIESYEIECKIKKCFVCNNPTTNQS